MSSEPLRAQPALAPAVATGGSNGALAHFIEAGYVPAEVPVLQPLDPFLELSGEDLRSRLFVTSDEQGNERCLRPEFTIPAALAYLGSGPAGRRADLVYCGPVFRHRAGESGEFVQLSAECLGRLDREAADADMLALAHEAVAAAAPGASLTVRIGDLALVSALFEALALDPATSRRLGLALSEGRILASLDALADPARRAEPAGLSRYPGVLDALKNADPAEARAFVSDLLSLAGVRAIGGRSAADIAGRFLDRARQESQTLGAERVAILRRFLSIEGDPDQVAGEVRALALEAGLDLAAPIDRFELRTGFIEARGIATAGILASAGLARNLDYYSGFVFDIRGPKRPDRPAAGGGRYDRLFERLGSPVAAIGAAIWAERLGPASEGAA